MSAEGIDLRKKIHGANVSSSLFAIAPNSIIEVQFLFVNHYNLTDTRFLVWR